MAKFGVGKMKQSVSTGCNFPIYGKESVLHFLKFFVEFTFSPFQRYNHGHRDDDFAWR